MRRLRAWVCALFAFGLAAPAFGQILQPSPQPINAVSSGVTNCVSLNCATWPLQNVNASVTSQITGTMTSMTLTAEGTTDGQTWFSVLVTKLSDGSKSTTTTATGQYALTNTGLRGFRWRCTTYSSGGVNVSLTGGSASSTANLAPGFPGAFTAGDLLYATGASTVAGLADVAVGQVLVSGGTGTAPAYSATPTVTSLTTSAANTFVVAGLAAGPATVGTTGLVMTNTTAATVGTQAQWSPPQQFVAHGWDIDGAVDVPTDCYWALRPVAGNNVTAQMQLMCQIGAGGYNQSLTVTNVGAVQVPQGANYNFAGRSIIQAGADGTIRLSNSNGTGFTGLQYGSSVLVDSFGVPSMGTGSSGFGSSTALVAGHDYAFQWNVGTGGTANTGTLTMGGTAANGWSCGVADVTNPGTSNTVQAASTTTTVTVNNYSRTLGTALAWAASDKLNFTCRPF